MSFLLELLKQHLGKSITFANLAIIVLLFWAADKFYFSQQYCLASEARQAQQTISIFVENEYRREITLLELKPRNTWTPEDTAKYNWYKEKLEQFIEKQRKLQHE